MCIRKKKQQKAAANVQSKKEQPSIQQQQQQLQQQQQQQQQNINKEKNSQREKDLTVKEIGAAPSNPINPVQEEKQPIKDESKKDKGNEELEGPYAAPGPANILPKLDPAELKEASEVFPVASLKKEIISNDRSADRMSLDNTLKEVPKRMPETDIVHDKDSAAQVFTNDQLL
uniref:Uncharacterized protein n=1 Tax=Panagrolaimus sp. ES5 TaxID=591445 RepID=A0AC34F0M7_9BILA